jgi:hypothetical protein
MDGIGTEWFAAYAPREAALLELVNIFVFFGCCSTPLEIIF